ncbi:histone deacetylase [Stylonychia lemnae]|uniref:Histone deacetylase n=1 Tax=Stylonychia lemnae TaxID=5949 RepID=A0A078AVU4_STYLE|nr:histone deacetylase [Stylonychia lemnae]|eukprot:CDW86211.1 histone deacetylase [Stylonychia lemnae]
MSQSDQAKPDQPMNLDIHSKVINNEDSKMSQNEELIIKDFHQSDEFQYSQRGIHIRYINETQIEEPQKLKLFRYARQGKQEEFEEEINKEPDQLKHGKYFSSTDPEHKSILHHTLLNANDEFLEYLLHNYYHFVCPNSARSPADFNSFELDGNYTLHLALTLAGYTQFQQRAINCVKTLIKYNDQNIHQLDIVFPRINIDKQDRLGRTILHLSAMHGLDELAQILLERNADLNVEDLDGHSPIIYSIDFKRPSIFQMIINKDQGQSLKLDNNGDNLSIRAIKQNSWECFAYLSQIQDNIQIDQKLQQIAINCDLSQEYEIASNQRYLQHAGFENYQNVKRRVSQKDRQPENAERLMVMIQKEKGTLIASEEFTNDQKFTQRTVTQKAKEGDVFRVHDYNYLMKVIKQTETLKIRDGDTVLSADSWDCSLLSCGAVIEACDSIMKGETRNAFCAVRPPGHHAGIYGKTMHHEHSLLCDQNKLTNGFCFINNVAVAACYLKNMYREKIKKVAIVDFDVHHGNGTQEIVEALLPKKFVVKYNTPFSELQETQYQCRPWLDLEDAKNVLFCSVHLFQVSDHEIKFYPGTGDSEENTKNDNSIYPGGVLNVPMTPRRAYGYKWMSRFQKVVFPRLLEFNPDFILISAGFDAHERDHLNHSDKASTSINEFQYQWVTENLQKIANKCCEGRMVSVLEGGYNTNAGPISPLAQSVKYHVRALLRTSNEKYNLNEDQEQIERTKRQKLKQLRHPQHLEQHSYQVKFD